MTLAVLQGIGLTELLIVLAIVLVIFGPKRLPQLGRQIGHGLREFTDSVRRRGDRDEDDDDDRPPRLQAVAGDPEPVDGEIVTERR